MKYLTERIKNRKNSGLRDFAWAAAFWGTFFIGGNLVNSFRNRMVYLREDLPVVASIEELEGIVEEEKLKLDIEGVDIDLNVSDEYLGGHSKKIGDGRYRLSINLERMSPLIVRHELYHIYRDINLSIFDFGPIEEWNATSYSLKE